MATIPFNLLFGLLLGLSFAACARTQLLSGAQPWRRELSLVLSFSLLTVAPVATYLYLGYPDWSWMYFVDPARLSRGTGLAVVVLTVLFVPIGYLLGWVVLRLLGEQWLFAFLGALLMGLGLLLGLCYRRFFFLGHYEDFQPGNLRGILLRPISQGKLFFALLCITPPVLIAASAVGWHLWGYGRWLRQQAAASLRTGEHPSRPNTRRTRPSLPYVEKNPAQ